jgi:UDP-N-acetylmuramoylalanine--D-glutamate ligase
MRIADLDGRRVAIWGFGREGRAAFAVLRRRLPGLQPAVLLDPVEAQGLAAADDVHVISQPPAAENLAAFDVVIKSPGISAYHPAIAAAAGCGTQFTSGTALWFGEHPQARVIAVTGTKGKSTVSALIAHCLRGLGRRTALAGNIGLPLLDLLDPAPPADWWVVELSSFQTRESGHVAVGVINNLFEEHLDWHGTAARYAADKLALAARAERLVVNARQPGLVAQVRKAMTGGAAMPTLLAFGIEAGWHLRAGAVFRGTRAVPAADASPLPGVHNALNVCAALAAIEAAGEDALAAAAQVATFRPLPHRLQALGSRDGLAWIDDSIATTPHASLEALASVGRRNATTLLAGGYERGLDWRDFAVAVRDDPPHAIVTMGANGTRIAETLEATGPLPYRLQRCGSLADAVAGARATTPVGGAVLLSPGAPSFDAFRDYAARGRAFAALAGFDAPALDEIEGLGVA